MADKTYRIQSVQQQRVAGNKKTSLAKASDEWRDQILDELAALREEMSSARAGGYHAQPGGGITNVVPMPLQPEEHVDSQTSSTTASLGKEIQEALKLKRELDLIYEAISETKKEIASISTVGFDKGLRPMDELDAVVHGTESATNQILEAIEKIEVGANQLAETLAGDEGVIANSLQDEILRVYEACNFQDITGQRITKVVSVLRFISDRTEAMIDIWGGSDGFEGVEAEHAKDQTGEKALLNGPALDADEASSQDDIDALFA